MDSSGFEQFHRLIGGHVPEMQAKGLLPAGTAATAPWDLLGLGPGTHPPDAVRRAHLQRSKRVRAIKMDDSARTEVRRALERAKEIMLDPRTARAYAEWHRQRFGGQPAGSAAPPRPPAGRPRSSRPASPPPVPPRPGAGAATEGGVPPKRHSAASRAFLAAFACLLACLLACLWRPSRIIVGAAELVLGVAMANIGFQRPDGWAAVRGALLAGLGAAFLYWFWQVPTVPPRPQAPPMPVAGGQPAPKPRPADRPPGSTEKDARASAAQVDGSVATLIRLRQLIHDRRLSAAEAERQRRALNAKLGAAQTLADRALRQDPHNRLAWVQKARALHYLGDDTGSLAVLTAGLSLFPGDPDLKRLRPLLRRVRR